MTKLYESMYCQNCGKPLTKIVGGAFILLCSCGHYHKFTDKELKNYRKKVLGYKR